MTDFLSLTPLVPAGNDLRQEVAFYVTRLGFTVIWQNEDMAAIRRGAVTLNLMRSGDRHWADNTSYSIGVGDLDALHAEYRQAGARTGPLETKAWGRREFHMIVPSGVCLQFFAQSGRETKSGDSGGG